jgi:hypothetical protein
MKRVLAVLLVGVFTVAGCVVVPERHGGPGPGPGVMIVPPLPPIVILEDEPYYYYKGYNYNYRDNGWYYSKSKNGPWTELPRDHYPGKVRFKGKRWKHERERDRDRTHEYDRY